MSEKINLIFLCEGYEEKPYIDKILTFPSIKKDCFIFNPSINVKTNSQIIPRYQDLFNKNIYDLILVFCDADKGSKEFLRIKKKFDDEIFGGKPISNLVFINVNPVTLQVVLSHFGDVSLTHKSKSNNAYIVESLTGIKGYKAKQSQIDSIINKITFTNYNEMKMRIKLLKDDINKCPSSNIYSLIKALEEGNINWFKDKIKNINKI